MKYFQTDDIPADEPKKDCIHAYYRIAVNGEIIKEGRHAVKQTRNIENRTIYKRMYNQSKHRWKDDNWVIFTPLIDNKI